METETTMADLKDTFGELIRILLRIEDAKINIIPFTGSWTAGQLGQHVILSAGGVVELINGPVTDTKRDPEENIPNLKAVFLDFSTKMKSPEFIVPEFKNYNKAALSTRLEEIKNHLLESISTLDTSKTCTLYEFPGSGHMTRAEAIAFTIVHTQRHVHQLSNIAKHLG
ncbi:MAG: DinB family protein [Chryseolinea sp.]